MADNIIFDYTLSLDANADVSIDYSAGQGYTSTSGQKPWGLALYVDGVLNSNRGGSGVASDVVSLIGAAGNLSAGTHSIRVMWYGDPAISTFGGVLRVLCTKK